MPYPSNVEPPIRREETADKIIAGQAYGVLYTQTIGGAAQGQYCLSIFNPSESGKIVRVTSIKTMVNYGNTTTWIYLNSADPAYNTDLSSAIVNFKGGGPPSVLGNKVTANSASTSFPSSGNVDMAVSTPELISNGMFYERPPGYGLNVLVFVGNSQEYAIAIKWLEI